MPAVTCIEHETKGVCDVGKPCCPHMRYGLNIEGTGLLEVGGQAVHLLSQMGDARCPHGGKYESIEGAALLEVNGLGVTLIGHLTKCKICEMLGEHMTGNDLLDVAG